VKYWAKRAIDDDYFIFWAQGCSSSDLRQIDLDWKRVNDIAQILGKEETDKAVKKAYEEAALEFQRDDWIVYRYGSRDEQNTYGDKGGQCFSDFEPGEAETIACSVVQRVLRQGTPEEQQTLIKDELTRYSKRLYGYKRGWRHAVEIFGIFFPGELRRLILSTGIDGSNPEPNSFFENFSIEQGKALLAILDEATKKGEDALEALVTREEERSILDTIDKL
jgi:hypothetical protein